MSRTPALMVTLGVAALLSACATGTATPAGTAAGDPDIAPAGGSSGERMGWRITVTNVLGEWSGKDVCGGDYIFAKSSGYIPFLDQLTGLDGEAPIDGPIMSIRPDDEFGYVYEWSTEIPSPEVVEGDYVEGWGPVEFAPDADGHPPARVEASGGNHVLVEADLAGTIKWGDDWVVFSFARAPEPEWCVEDEEWSVGTDGEWHYYD